MSLDSNLKIEIISLLLGQEIKPYDEKIRGETEDILSVDDFHLHTLIGKRQANVRKPVINEEDFFDPGHDCDFTYLSDSAKCMRGDELYKRPKGWYRIALKVKGKYPDGDTWLGPRGWRSHSVPGEWPVSYHGTSLKGAKGIIRSHYKAGNGDVYGRGIYSTPDIHVAEREEYAQTFTSKTTGKSYKVILQNRINPMNREICERVDYWLVRVKEGTSAKEEGKIVENSIRPYGILIKELNDDEEDGAGDNGDEADDDEHNDGDSDPRYDDGSFIDSYDDDGYDDGNHDDDDNECNSDEYNNDDEYEDGHDCEVEDDDNRNDFSDVADDHNHDGVGNDDDNEDDDLEYDDDNSKYDDGRVNDSCDDDEDEDDVENDDCEDDEDSEDDEDCEDDVGDDEDDFENDDCEDDEDSEDDEDCEDDVGDDEDDVENDDCEDDEDCEDDVENDDCEDDEDWEDDNGDEDDNGNYDEDNVDDICSDDGYDDNDDFDGSGDDYDDDWS